VVSAASHGSPWVGTPPTPCKLGPDPPAAGGASRSQWSRVALCHGARATSSGVAPSARGSSRRRHSSSSSDSASIGWFDPRPAGVPPTMVPDELPTASTRGGPKGGAPSRRCPSRGEG